MIPDKFTIRVIIISSIFCLIGSEVFFRYIGTRTTFPLSLLADLIYVPVSVAVWLILSRFLRTNSLLRVAVVGAISPLLGCLVGVVYAGAGLYWLPWVIAYYYIFAPIGVFTSFAIWSSERGNKRGISDSANQCADM